MKKRDGFDPLSIVSKIADQEKEMTGQTFIAPYVGGGKVRLRLSGIVYEMDVSGCPEGWSIFEVKRVGRAEFLQRAPLTMVKTYQQLFPQVRLVLINEFSDKRWWGIAASGGKQKINLNGPVPIQLTERISSFDTVYCRFDGAYFWFESVDRRRDPVVARQLRKALADNVNPDELHCKGMIPQEKFVYKMLYIEKHRDLKIMEKVDDRTRIARALEHSGAQLDGYWTQNGGAATVRFDLDGRTHMVQVRASDLSVISAGICLSGQDGNFDLTSLVGVLREANDEYFYD